MGFVKGTVIIISLVSYCVEMHMVLWFQILLHSANCFECQHYPIKGVTSVSTPTPLPQPITKPQCSDTTINGDMDGVISAYYYEKCTELSSNPSFNNRITSIGSYAFQYCTSLTTITLPKDVKHVGYGAFKDCTSIVTITFPNCYCENIEANAFQNCNELKTLTIPRYIMIDCISITTNSKNVETISIQENNVCSYAFSPELAKFDLYVRNSKTVLCRKTNSVVTTAYSVGSIDIPETINTLNVMAYRCDGLTGTITIPAQIITLNQDAFDGCNSITHLIINGKVQYIDKFAFRETRSLIDFTINNYAHSTTTTLQISYVTVDGSIYSADRTLLLCTPTARASNVFNIPYQLKEFSPICFASHSCKTSQFRMYTSDGTSLLNLPSIGEHLIIDHNGICVYDSLTQTTLVKMPPGWNPVSFTIPDIFTVIGNGAFANSNIQKDISFNNIVAIGEWAFYKCKALNAIMNVSQIVSIGRQAFHACWFTQLISPPIKQLTEYVYSYAAAKVIAISEGVEVIERSVCLMGSVENLTLPSTLKEISFEAFKNSQLKHIDFPNISLNYIGQEAFFGCAKLDYIIIPASVKIVDSLAFADCTTAQFALLIDCNTCCHQTAFRSNDKRLQPECIATYWFTGNRYLCAIRPIDLFAQVITGAVSILECVIHA